MAATYTTESVIVAFKLLSKDKSKTWDGNSFENHSAVSTYATDGNLTFTDDPSPAGGNETEYTVTLPTLPITGGADTFYLVPFTATPAYTGGYIVGAVPQDNWKRLTVKENQELVDEESLAEGGGGGGGLTEEEVEDIVDERIGALVGVALSADGHLTKVTVEADQDASFSFPFTSETELTGSTLNFNVFAPGSDTNLFQRATGGNGITISGTTITVAGTSTHTATAGEYWFRLRNMSNDGKVIGKGVMLIHAGN